MKEVYSKLPPGNWRKNCSSAQYDVGQTVFENGKKLFDYSYDYNYISRHAGDTKKPLCESLNKKFEEAKTAYTWLCSHCETQSDKYCDKFKEEYIHKEKCKNTELPKLECTTPLQEEVDEEELEDPSSGLGVTKQDCNLENLLPSTKYYEKYKGGMTSCNGSSQWPDRMEHLPVGERDIEDYAEQAAKAVCCVFKQVGEEKESDEYCPYLYYWIGDIVSTWVNDNLFPGVMKHIYEKVKAYSTDFPCTNVYENIDSEQFNRMKSVYDYYKDYDTINQQLQSGNSCKDDIDDHLGDICGAYKYMEEACKNGQKSSQQCCQDFRTWFKDPQYKELLGKGCTMSVASEVEALSATDGGITSPSGSTNIALTIIPTAVAAIGLPSIVFLLYKYDLLPSGIKNTLSFGKNSSSSRRNRRSTSRNEFDTLTSMDDSTTDTSTIYDGTDSNTEYSAPFSTAHSRTRNNNRQHKNIGYQNR
ncbi:KIR protein [Plasmodium coatneyi]|uniref:KIR protein n=1 Tax=Plasmodium coatneyi TaxID=208452 RepID=A0A1B1DXK8_9APIC|nr:KIR protein [Plasmodium coatneyi]ANQ07512.1 KIR protein [Plasmodium coatneyi]